MSQRMSQLDVDRQNAKVFNARMKEDKPQPIKMKSLTITISGQIMGGKNNIIITRTGRRFPNRSFAKWRDAALQSVLYQLPSRFEAIDKPCEVFLRYVAGDKRRRDMPAIIDSIFHVLEKAGVVTDDTLLWVTGSTRSYDKANPHAMILIDWDNK